MADVNTNDSETSTTEAPATETPQDTSTTETLLTATPKKETPEAEQPATGEPNPLFGAPEASYEITGLPEGVEIDKDALAAFEPVAKELGLSNEGMSKVAAAYAEILPKVTENLTATLEKDIAAQHATWATEAIEMVKTDTTFGGKPLSEVQQLSAKAIDRFAGAEFRTFLDETGLGNHPAMLKFAFNAGSAIAEDTSFERGGTAPAAKSRVEKYFGPQT